MSRTPRIPDIALRRTGNPVRTPAPGAFTLIELLVVLAIIAVLAAILFPVLAAVRDRSRAVTCVSQSREVGTGLMLYLQDYDERYPQSFPSSVDPAASNSYKTDTMNFGTPFEKMSPYFSSSHSVQANLLACPSDPDPAGASLINDKGVCFYSGHYERPSGPLSSYLFNAYYVFGATLSDIDEPSRSINMAERSTGFCNVYYRPWRQEILPPANASDTLNPIAIAHGRHSGSSTFVYADGHVKLVQFPDTVAPFDGHEEYGEHQPF